ncbi:MAG: hypothetical protein GYB68_04680 [Chloroflexi bacterium]|nr:hypothetical protein [Chloroflexota bacterium]
MYGLSLDPQVRRQRRQRLIIAAVVLALVAAAAITWRVREWSRLAAAVGESESAAQADVSPSATPTQTGPNASDLLEPVQPLVDQTLTPAITPAGLGPMEQWANAIVTNASLGLRDVPPTSGGLAWWQGINASGPLGITAGQIAINGQGVALAEAEDGFILSIPDPANVNQLYTLGELMPDRGAMVLTASSLKPPFQPSQWRVSVYQPVSALETLLTVLEEQGVIAHAAYDVEPGSAFGGLVLVELEQREVPPTLPVGTWTPTPAAIPTATPLPTATITPTRAPERIVGEFVASAIAPFLLTSDRITPSSVYTFAGHPWIGLLTVDEQGLKVDGRAIPIRDANQLSVYTLLPDDVTGERVLILSGAYVGSVTQVPGAPFVLQGRRMDELLFWIVQTAGQEGGQVRVVYDDFGPAQEITMIGFQPFADLATPQPDD